MKNTKSKSKSTIENETQTQAETPAPAAPAAVGPRVGKIAALPTLIRDELNQRIEEGEGGEPLLQWLNQRAEAWRRTQDESDGKTINKPINKQNLSDWRKGGYAEWVLCQDLLEQATSLYDQAGHIEHNTGDFLADSLVKVFTARYAALLARWDGEASAAFDAKLSLFTRMRRDLLSLQESAHATARLEREWKELGEKDEQREKEELRKLVMAPVHAHDRREKMSKIYGPAGEVVADALTRIDYEDSYPFLEDLIPDEEPTPTPVATKTKKKVKTVSRPRRVKKTKRPSAPQPKSQGAPVSAQKVAPEKVNPEKPATESSPVKPLSEPSASSPSPQTDGGTET